jgi:hypothetical protein
VTTTLKPVGFDNDLPEEARAALVSNRVAARFSSGAADGHTMAEV